MNKFREAIACLTCPRQSNCDSLPTINGRPKHAQCKEQLGKVDQLFALRVEGCRLAAVKEVGELPQGPYLPFSEGEDREYRIARNAYSNSQQDMVDVHYVQEAKDD